MTVLTTVLNGERFLEETLASIAADGYPDYEHVVVDDGSTDGTPEILSRWQEKDVRNVVVRRGVNSGIPAAANAGLAVARGLYVARLDADDVSLPGRLARQASYLDAHPGVVLVSMNYELMREDGTVFRRTHHAAPPEAIRYYLNFGNSVGGHSQVMYRRDAVLELGGYSEECPFALDYELWTRLAQRGDFVILPDTGMRYRLHRGSVSVRSRDRQREISEAVAQRVLSRYLGREVTGEEARALAHTWKGLAPAKDFSVADRLLREAYRLLRDRDGANADTLRSVRRGTASHLMTTAAVSFDARRLADAVRHGVGALRWHPLAALRSAFRLLALASLEILRRRSNRESRRG